VGRRLLRSPNRKLVRSTDGAPREMIHCADNVPYLSNLKM
jgi:hypothetical protein